MSCIEKENDTIVIEINSFGGFIKISNDNNRIIYANSDTTLTCSKSNVTKEEIMGLLGNYSKEKLIEILINAIDNK